MLKKIKLDSYLKSFVDFCKQRYGKNLIAIGIYGSYAWGYFDKEKSDYDVFLIFNSKRKDETGFLSKRFKNISINYFCDRNELLKLINEGHWSLYITLLKSAKMLYSSSEYNKFFNELKNTDFVKNLKNTDRIKFKAKFDRNQIQKMEGYPAIKYAFPGLRSRLQLLTYIHYKKLVWDLKKVFRLNKDILSSNEQKFLIQLEKSVRKRKNVFPNKKMAINLLNRINKEILYLLNPTS